jgi:hypothetical protein
MMASAYGDEENHEQVISLLKARLKTESKVEKEKNKERRGTQIDSDVNIGHGQDFYNSATTFTLKINGKEIKPGDSGKCVLSSEELEQIKARYTELNSRLIKVEARLGITWIDPDDGLEDELEVKPGEIIPP